MDWTNPWVIGPLCAGIGVLVGMFIMRLLGDDGSSAQKATEELREEFNDYRTSVGQHFATTSDLFQDMTEKYRDVYNHMASGAQEFGGKDSAGPRLEIVGAEGSIEQSVDAKDVTDEARDTGSDEVIHSDPDQPIDTAPDDATRNTAHETVNTSPDAATKNTADDATQATVQDAVSPEKAPDEVAAADEPAPPIDYDAQTTDAFATEEVVIKVEPSEQLEVSDPPPPAKTRVARGPSRWGFKSKKPDG